VAIAVLATLAAVAGHLAVAAHTPRWREPISVAAAIATVVVMAQLVPLPIALVDAIAPDAADSVRRTAALLDRAAPTWATLSMSPVATRQELVEGLAVLAVFVVAWGAAASGERLWTLRIAATSIALVGLVTVAHWMLDLRRPFGIFDEPYWHPAWTGPLLNVNTLGGVLAAGAPAAAACGLDERRLSARAPWLAIAGGMAGLAIATFSRGAILSLIVGVTVLGILLRWRRGRANAPTTVLAVGAAVAALFVLTTLAALVEPLVAETARGTPRFEVYARSLDLAARAPWIGVGRGAYSVAFVRLWGTLERAEYPENLELQWLTELGAPTAILLVAALSVTLWRAAKVARSTPQLGAIAAVVSLAVHDQFDFACEIAGVGVLAACLLGAALAPSGGAKRAADRNPMAERRLSPGLAGALTCAAALVLGPGAIAAEARTLAGSVARAAQRRDWQALERDARAGIEAHPSEPLFPMMLGYSAVVRNDPAALRWLNRAMVLGPHWWGPHRLAAQWLARHGAIEQAWLEVREIRQIQPDQAGYDACIVGRREGSSEAAIRIFADDPELLDGVVRCAGIGEEDAARIDAFLAERGLPGPVVRRARAALRAGRPDEAIRALDRLEEGQGGGEAAFARADAQLALGRAFDAAAILEAERQRAPTREVLERLARAYAQAGDAERMRSTIQRIVEAEQTTPVSLAQSRLLLADLEESLGNVGHATRALEEARRLDPTGPALERILAMAERTGDGRRAQLARMELCRRDGQASPFCAEREGTPAQLDDLP
jgi:tetratricopeptide (TPR) repeat protein